MYGDSILQNSLKCTGTGNLYPASLVQKLFRLALQNLIAYQCTVADPNPYGSEFLADHRVADLQVQELVRTVQENPLLYTGTVSGSGWIINFFLDSDPELFVADSDVDPVELLYRSGSRIRKSSIQIRIRIQGKNFSQNSIFQNFVEKRVGTYLPI